MDYVEVNSISGLHAGVNPITGDFSLGFSGKYYRQGEISFVDDCIIAGNFYQMIKDVDFVGNKLYANSSRDFFTPKIIFDELTISS